jgi:hypothetical protein
MQCIKLITLYNEGMHVSFLMSISFTELFNDIVSNLIWEICIKNLRENFI